MRTPYIFKNHPLSDFSVANVRTALQDHLLSLERQLSAKPFEVTPIINGAPESHGKLVSREDPSDKNRIIANVDYATVEQASRAVAVCQKALPAWRARTFEERAAIIERAGHLIRERAAYFTSLVIKEAGKPWRDSDADIAEAIDFCVYYAAEMRRLGPPTLTEQVLGEENYYLYQPRGVVTVIAPWNFPLAIACGMVAAALVTGNTVVFKPAEQSSATGQEMTKIFFEAGVPAECLAFLPGQGEEVGRALVENPAVSMIVFTGSRPVGLEIISSAAAHPGQQGIKRVVAELGGKNAIIVDEDADFDDAIRGVLTSAFGYAGQKCSACSRLIIVGSAYEPFLERLAAATKDIIIGPSKDSSSFLGPVIDEQAYNRINTAINSAIDLTILARGSLSDDIASKGWYIAPTVFRDVPDTHTIWRDEIFAPVLACAQAKSFDHALDMANGSEYALTGGVYTRNPEHLARAKEDFRVGNLYINRGITGALVCRQPFGGFKFSGVGSKAGGRDYLLQFMEPRVVTENTMRRGFTPDLNS
jgi:RHH-type proline utilization regulon transcriptional repressor/proline dehydrogenase/delta 1-pyrroline-5-carboxylate dehydrogenase